MHRAPQRAGIVRRCDNVLTCAESEILQKLSPSMEAIRERMPHRTALAIRYMAKRCGVIPHKVQHIWAAAQGRALKRMADLNRSLGRGKCFPLAKDASA